MKPEPEGVTILIVLISRCGYLIPRVIVFEKLGSDHFTIEGHK